MSRPLKRRRRAMLKLSDADTIRFLELYRGENVLYDITMEDYRNRDLRTAAASRIAAALNIPGFRSVEVLAKFKNLRNAYSQELKKIEGSKEAGASADNVYIPKVHWFSTMNVFLRPFIYQKPTPANIEVPSKKKQLTENPTDPLLQDVNVGEVKIERDEEINANSNSHQETLPRDPGPGKSLNVVSSNGGKRKCAAEEDDPRGNKLRETPKSSDDNVSTATSKPREAESSTPFKQEDVYDCFGKYIAALLRSVGNPRALRIQQEVSNLVLSRITQPEEENLGHTFSASPTTSSAFQTSQPTDVFSPG